MTIDKIIKKAIKLCLIAQIIFRYLRSYLVQAMPSDALLDPQVRF